jgi:UDP-N-acetylmuramyl pentapeptide synthase
MASRIRAVLDAAQLVWPVTGGYKLRVHELTNSTWPLMRRLASSYRRGPIRGTCVVAIVGSLGKTTTRRMVAASLGLRQPRYSDSNYGVRLAANLLRTRPWHREVVLEAGISGPGVMGQFGRMIQPDIAVVTAIASDHNRSLPTLEHTRAEKVKMVRELRPGGVAVLNGDDPHVRWMATQTTARVITYGFNPDNDIRAAGVQSNGLDGMRFTLHADGRTAPVSIRLIGAHLVYAALAAIAVGLARGRRLDDLIARVSVVPPVPQRLEPVTLPNGATLVQDDFKGSPSTVFAALEAFRAIPARRRLVVLGPLDELQGSFGPIYRDFGQRLSPWADRVILIGSTDALRTAITGAVQAGLAREIFTRVRSVHEVIAILREEVAEGDAVLIKGTGAQRLERIALALQGHPVRCAARLCKVKAYIRCEECPLLSRDPAVFENVHLRSLVQC